MKSLLIIDDDEDMGDALFTILTEEQYQVHLASSGIEGLALAQKMKPDLILLDWQMPQMNGSQVLLKLSSIKELKDVPIILMSANITNIPSNFLKNHLHLSKPFDLTTLIELVAKQFK